ncbi:MAG TPA: 5-formyltetrahydrofolate cyclo-ligase [Candidatus Bacteroides merdigallinarum]|uniref:5-formyltetrahydrofolate cyclo-ligase n=1 Tax=Candidatus Bacteroides merdigallinarum TaxID=2838473 RepID=A0A9D2EA98_9BACE|nr:5-formyltetrahydrofolate cyclo-ligase [Candidatus Bacteroides merdigallinarum]
MLTKTELRKEISRRKTLHKSSAWHAQQTADLLAALEAHPQWQAAHTVLLYHSLPDEVDTHTFVRRWSGRKRILLPVVKGTDLELRLYTGDDHLAEGAFHIDEPTGPIFTDYAEIDLAVIPGVAFDRRGNRLGRGKGYYDRLLPRIPTAYKLGLCFPFQLVEQIPAEAHDIPMDEVLTANQPMNE